MLLFVQQWIVLFFIVLLLGYLLPAGQFYLRFFIFPNARTEARRIQQRTASRDDILRELRYSLSTVVIFAFLGTLLWRLYLTGHTSIYWRWRDYPWWYHPLSFVMLLLFHDTYFYWTHRLMHWRPLFKYAHWGHHRSFTPTPWAIYAFQPVEAVIQFGILALPVTFLPLQPWVLLAYLSYDSFINTAGHAGHEIFPPRLARIWPFSWLNTVTHHDSHHTNTRVNFGAFFNIWDRLMGTFHDAQHAPTPPALNSHAAIVTKSQQTAGR